MIKESSIQQQIVIWFRNNNLNTDNIIFSVPNDSKSQKETLFKKATGLLPGVSDLIVIYKGIVIFVEVKNEIGIQSPKQKEFQDKVTNNGLKYFLVRSLEDFKKIIITL